MRLFVAVDVDEETRAQCDSIAAAMAAVLAGARVPPRVAWVPGDRAHVTVRFLGEQSDTRVAAIREALARPLGLTPFDVRWDYLGTFPGGRRPRVIWLGASAGADRLDGLARAISDRLSPLTGPGEGRAFRAHITLGRVKESGTAVDWTTALAAARVRPTTTRVDHVTLYASRLSPRGPTYTALCGVRF